MDALGLQTLASELEADVVVVVAAINLAGRRFAEATPSGHDSAAHHLSRAYNVIEQMALRVAKVFENNVDDERGFVHAYDLTIDPERLRLVLKHADVVRERIPGLVSAFVAAVADEQGLARPFDRLRAGPR